MTTTYAAQGGETPDAAWVPPTWEEVVEQHSARVYRLAYRLTGNVHDAEDLTQDVFVRVFRSLHTYQPGTFEGWLHRITTNVFLDKMRRKQRIRFDALSDESAARLPSTRPRPGADLPRRPLRRRRAARARRPLARTSGPPSCCATSRDSPTRRSPRPWASSSARCARASTAAAPSCASRSPTAPPSPPPPRLRPRAAGPDLRRPAAGVRMTDAMRVQCQGDELTEYAAGRLPRRPPVGVGPPPGRLPGLRPRGRAGAPAAQCARRCPVDAG